MNYATWKLNFTDPKYGTGPEETIADLGFDAEGAWVAGEPQDGGAILGYVTKPLNESELATWQLKNVSEAEALEFCLSINPEAYLLDDGRITIPIEDNLR